MKRVKELFILGVMLVFAVALTSCGKTTINLNKYVTVTFEGYDSMGTAVCTFDYDSFKEDFSGKLKLSPEVSTSQIALDKSESIEEILLGMCVSKKLDKKNELSNGDTVKLTWKCDIAMAEKYFDAALEYADVEYKVVGLKEVEEFNPFDYVEVSFAGTSPDGRVAISPDSSRDEIQSIKFVADKQSKIKIGDVITVNASIIGSYDKFVEKYGSVLSETERVYTVDSLAHYADSVGEISDESINKIVEKGEQVFRDYVSREWNKPENLVSVSCAGNYFLTMKEGLIGGINNEIYIIYNIKAINPEPKEEVNFFYYVYFDNLVIAEDGSCEVDLNSYGVPKLGWISSEGFKVGQYTYVGYTNLNDFYNSCIKPKEMSYTYTTTVK